MAEKNDVGEFKGVIGNSYRDSTPHWPQPVMPQKGSPNFIFIVLDDMGFSDLGCYGSEISTPALDSLASGGLRYNNFHVTAMCSPTRACLLTGRNAHAAGVGIVAEWSNGYPGYEGRITRRAATLPEILREQGYGTYAVGKWHLTNIENFGAAGPHDDWPLGRGFSSWYGFHGGMTDQWNPELYQDNRPINVQPSAEYHLSTDLVDQAIGRVRDHITSAGARPFMLYLAFGAPHWPHHVPPEYIAKYHGHFDAGWDVIRAQRLTRQMELGIVPKGTQLAPRNTGVAAWTQLSSSTQRLSLRLQETYAGFIEHTDHQIERLINYLKTTGQYDNTCIVLLSDNGASDAGGTNGSFNMYKHMVYEPDNPEGILKRIDEIGSQHAFNHYPAGWAQVSNTPLKWYKRDTHGGGIRAPLILHWPARIKATGQIRSQYHHVIDLAPTVYELLGIDAPMNYRGFPQIPIHGTSALYTIDSANEPTRKITQYFEIFGDRAVWHDGWKAVARHSKGTDFDQDKWELYNVAKDFSETIDLAEESPAKLREMVDLWWREAKKYEVLPLDDRDWERTAERLRMSSTTRFTMYPDMARLDRLIAPNISDRSYVIKADIDLSEEVAEGVLLAWGSRFGGMALYLQNGKPYFEYIYSDSEKHLLSGPEALRPGARSVAVHFERTSSFAGVATLIIDGVKQDEVAIPRTWPTHGVSAGLTCGMNHGLSVTDRYSAPFSFTARLHRVSIDVIGSASSTEQLVKAVIREE